MAKKKASSKKSTVKKVVKKTETKTKKTPKKAVKAAKKAAPVKKAANRKGAAKKAVKSTATRKSAAKAAPVKKQAEKKAAGNVVKTSAKAAKKNAKVSKTSAKKATTSTSHLTKAAPVMKKLDLTGFVTPLDDRLLVKTSGTEKMTPGGLYIPDTVADTSGNLEGFVVAVGRGHMNKKGHVRPMDVKVGDRIVFSQYAGSTIKIQNEDLVILREADVMGVVAK